ncbi:MAG: hypothetical protein AVO33_05605 [delta proteobacterium ML8_F1]|jgi:hypothetical protein|nr:MAG: hypothetical protein AVO33_05605 [delta proteobacterium ML8_F1]
MVFFKMPLAYLEKIDKAYKEQVYEYSEAFSEALITGYEEMAALNREYSEFGFFADMDGMLSYEENIPGDDQDEN